MNAGGWHLEHREYLDMSHNSGEKESICVCTYRTRELVVVEKVRLSQTDDYLNRKDLDDLLR